MQEVTISKASPQTSEATYLSKIGSTTDPSISYSSDIAADWSIGDKANKVKGKASVAGSLYYTASDSGTRSDGDSVYDAVSLPDSDNDFRVELGPAGQGLSLIALYIPQGLCNEVTAC